jgi:predicted amidohydrolase
MRAPFSIAAVQAAPVFMDREATVEKACSLIATAAKAGAQLMAFPEAYVPGYPDWVCLDPLYATFRANSVSAPSEATQRLGEAARRAHAFVVIGVSQPNAEASGASLYNTLLYFGADGALLGTHRKLVPTGGERLVWAQGDGSTLAVYQAEPGRLGGLVCWEREGGMHVLDCCMETILYAQIDPELAGGSKWILDTAGHYARPDVFSLSVDQRAHPMLGNFTID